MLGLFDGIKIGTGAVIGAMLCYPVAHYLGERDGRQAAAQAALQKTVEILQSRELTNAEINSSDAAALCEHFGLPDEERIECVRRLVEATAQP